MCTGVQEREENCFHSSVLKGLPLLDSTCMSGSVSRMVPGQRLQISLFTEIHRRGSARHTSVWQAACLLSAINKQETGGVAACEGPRLVFIFHTQKRTGSCLSWSEIMRKAACEVRGESQQSDGIHPSGLAKTSTFTAPYLANTLPSSAGKSSWKSSSYLVRLPLLSWMRFLNIACAEPF